MNRIIKAGLLVILGALIGAGVLHTLKHGGQPTDAAPPPTDTSRPSTRAGASNSIEGANPTRPADRERSAAARKPAPKAAARSFETRMRDVLQGKATPDEQLAFWDEVKNSGQLDDFIAKLKEATAAAPDDITTRLDLGLAYVSKIWSSPDGPAKGIWAGKAEQVWQEVLAIDPQNWEAQRNIAFSHSQYPDFLNKTGEAIKDYETTIAIQEKISEPRDGFADSYLQLARLHIKNGDPASARATLEQGLAALPNNPALANQLQTILSSHRFEDQPAPEQ